MDQHLRQLTLIATLSCFEHLFPIPLCSISRQRAHGYLKSIAYTDKPLKASAHNAFARSNKVEFLSI